jgi:hypothetical protein
MHGSGCHSNVRRCNHDVGAAVNSAWNADGPGQKAF